MAIDSGTVKISVECDNPTWLEIINSGMEAPEVTGGIVHLPDGGIRMSKAAVTGGTYTAGAEPASYAMENGMKILHSVATEEFRGIIAERGLSCTASDLEASESFFTDILKNEFIKIADEYMDNPDETKATNEIIKSLVVKVAVDSFNMPDVKEHLIKMMKDAIGGGS